jgi:RNA polymerase sigma factor (sigma-70 family)
LWGLWETCGHKQAAELDPVSFEKLSKTVMSRRVLDWLSQNRIGKKIGSRSVFSLESLLEKGWDIKQEEKTNGREEACNKLAKCLSEMRNDVMRKVMWQIARGLSEKEIARRMGVSIQRVSKIYRDGIKQIRVNVGIED